MSDARYCAGMGVQYLGFPMDRNSEDFIDRNTLETIKEWIVGPEIVGEFPVFDPAIIDYPILREQIDYIEISDPDSIDFAGKTGLPLILNLDISSFRTVNELKENLNLLNDRVRFFILNGVRSPEIKDSDILNLASQFKIMIGFDIDRQSIHSWIDETKVFGIALRGGKEIRPGFKDYDELAEILEEIEID